MRIEREEAAMNVHETRRYQMLERVRRFGAMHRDAFAPIGLAGRMFAAVEHAVAAVEAHASRQSSALADARQRTIGKAAARQTLLDRLVAICRTARALALDENTQTLARIFVLPRAPSDFALVTVARACATHAAPWEHDFVAHALPATFLADLHSAIAEFDDASRERLTAKGAHTSARLGIEQSVDTGFLAVRRLDAIVVNHLQGNGAALAAWRRARRIERSPVRTTRTMNSADAVDVPTEKLRADQRQNTTDQELIAGRVVAPVAVPERQLVATAEERGPVTRQRHDEPHEIPGGVRPHLAA
jgi:hypothetical protein